MKPELMLVIILIGIFLDAIFLTWIVRLFMERIGRNIDKEEEMKRRQEYYE